jgi:hypothetical protein
MSELNLHNLTSWEPTPKEIAEEEKRTARIKARRVNRLIQHINQFTKFTNEDFKNLQQRVEESNLCDSDITFVNQRIDCLRIYGKGLMSYLPSLRKTKLKKSEIEVQCYLIYEYGMRPTYPQFKDQIYTHFTNNYPLDVWPLFVESWYKNKHNIWESEI